MCADLYTVFIFKLIAIAESSGSKIEIFIHGGALAPLPGARDTGPSPNRKWGAAVIAGRAFEFSPQGAIVSADIFFTNI